MLYHDHLSIFWEKETLDYMKSKPCPTDDQPDRTWYDRVIKIVGKNNELVHKRYQNKLPGDSPEMMPLDCHLFADLREGLALNIAMSFWMKADNPLKYKGATPLQIFDAIRRTIKNGTPCKHRIIEDCYRIANETHQRIIDANGTFIEDSSGKKTRSGVRLEGEKEAKRQIAIKADPQLTKEFHLMFEKVTTGEIEIPCSFDYNQNSVDAATAFVSIDPNEEDEVDGENENDQTNEEKDQTNDEEKEQPNEETVENIDNGEGEGKEEGVVVRRVASIVLESTKLILTVFFFRDFQ